jgi:hypothetical protein
MEIKADIQVIGHTREAGELLNAEIKKALALKSAISWLEGAIDIDFCGKVVANTGFFEEAFRGIEPSQVLLVNIKNGDFWLLTDVYPCMQSWKRQIR